MQLAIPWDGGTQQRCKKLRQVVASLWKNVASKVGKTRPSEAQSAAHRELLDERSRVAMWFGIAAFAFNLIEPWFDFPDRMPIKIQLGFLLVIVLMTASSYTRWGARHKLGIFTCGFLITVAGFEANVVYEHAFGTEYAAGFPVYFAFYCVLIPTTVSRTALVGAAAMAIPISAEVWATGHPAAILRGIITNNTAFLILLYGRRIANSLWAAEFRAKERELAAIQVQADFISTVVHDFRTPLTPLCNLSEQLALGQITEEAGRLECYRALVEESSRLRNLILGLLDFGRVEATATDYRFQKIDPAEVVQMAVREFQRDIDVRGYHVQVQISDKIPFVRADPVAIKSVLWNLLDNAMKYSPDCQTVWLDVDCDNEQVAIRIKDQGLGIPDVEQIRIFDKFVRGDAAKNNAIRGTGVGLAIVRHIVTAHGGDIEVTSKVNQGSTFTVRLHACH